jgi:hypothetical protein
MGLTLQNWRMSLPARSRIAPGYRSLYPICSRINEQNKRYAGNGLRLLGGILLISISECLRIYIKMILVRL